MNTRLEKLRKLMGEENLPALLVTSPYNLRYLTNFTGTTGLALITLEKAFFVTDFRYLEQVAAQVSGYEIVENKGPILQEVEHILEKESISTLGFEKDHVTYSTYEALEELSCQGLIPVSEMIESLREIKDEKEIATIKKAISISDAAYDYILKMIKPGMSEIEVANQLDFFMRAQGATSVSFDTIVASGKRSAMPHGVASNKLLEKGDMVTLDFGCYYEGYVSDMTRTFALGDPGEKMKEIYDIVLKANEAVIEAAKAGVSGADLDEIARKIIGDAGYGENFGHGLGHGIGLEIHEGPAVSKNNHTPFVPGNIITDEPGIYLPGLGGVRIEDDLLILENSCEVLTKSPKTLIILE